MRALLVRSALFGAAILSGLAAPAVRAQQPAPPSEEGESIKLPGNSVDEVLSLYEMYSGKRLIRDANLAGPNLKIVIPGKVSRQDAIAILESALLLNGYTLVDADESTVKVIGPSKSALGESIPLYADPLDLPRGEQIVSYFMLLKYISPKDAIATFDGYVTLRQQGAQQGKIVAVPNSNALVITDNTPLIRRLINLQRMIDVPGAKVLTEFVPLMRANAEKVAETINKVLEDEKQKEGGGKPTIDSAVSSIPNNGQGAPGAPPNGQPANVPAISGLGVMTVASTNTQVIADVRTNRILIVAAESKMGYLKKLVEDLDVPVNLEPPLKWQLRFVSAGEVLPVLQSILAEGDEEGKQSSDPNSPGGSSSSRQMSQSSSNSGYSDGSYGSSGFGSSGSGSGRPDKLRDPEQSTAPLAVSVGKVRIIADRSANKIIVIGPPESKMKAANVLEMLDQKPKQIYLATVIGQLTLGEGEQFGIQYPSSVPVSIGIHGSNRTGVTTTATTGNTSTSTSGTTTNSGNTVINANGIDVAPGTTETLNTAFQLANTIGAPFLSGLTIYGIVGDTIDLYVNALESTNHFKIISRPVIYTANNKKAVISSGQQVPVPQSTLTSSLAATSQGTSVASNIEYKDVVLKLEVIPLINSNNEVTLTIAQQNDNIQGNTTISDNTVPIVGTQELTTTVTVPNKHTVVLGGLITEEESMDRSGLPFLSSLPVVGYAFGYKKKSITRRELIIMIQPFIINSPEDELEANRFEKSMSSMNGELYDDKVENPRLRNLAPMPVQAPPVNWRSLQQEPAR